MRTAGLPHVAAVTLVALLAASNAMPPATAASALAATATTVVATPSSDVIPFQPWPCLISPLAQPVWVQSTAACPDGYHCPNTNASAPNTFPQVCQPTTECRRSRLNGEFCEAQGLYEPTVCLAGYFCPNGTVQAVCPEGFYCPEGSQQPIECLAMSTCPVGSVSQRFWGAMVIVGSLDLVLFVIVTCLNRRDNRAAQSHAKAQAHAVAALTSHISGRGPAMRYHAVADDDAEGGRAAAGSSSGGTAGSSTSEGPGDRRTKDFASRMLRGIARACRSHSTLAGGAASGGGADAAGEASAVRLEVAFEDLSLRLPSGKVLLHGASGALRPGKFTAIMGPTGAGKTTLLRCILGKERPTGGVVSVNGRREVSMGAYRKLIGYVPQADVMHTQLTVREVIEYSARVRLPRSFSSAEVTEYVDSVVGALGLEWAQHTLIGDNVTRGVSGGERKRTNIGIELAAAPVLLCCDEPSSGLDTTSALRVCRTLKDMASLGLTVVAVIHQPRSEIFDLLDDVVLLQPGGVTVYSGAASGAVPHMEGLGFTCAAGTNPADFLLDVCAGHATKNMPPQSEGAGGSYGSVGGEAVRPKVSEAGAGSATSATSLLSDAEAGAAVRPAGHRRREREDETSLGGKCSSTAAWISDVCADARRSLTCSSATPGGDAADSLDAARVTQPLWRQILLSHNRAVTLQYRTAGTLFVEALLAGIAGCLMGISSSGGPLYRGVLKGEWAQISPAPNDSGVPLMCFFILLAMGVAAAPPGVHVFASDLTVYWREAGSGHSRLALFVGKAIASTYRTTVACLHFACLLYTIATPRGEFLRYVAASWCAGYYVYGIGGIVGVVATRTNAALAAVIISMAMAATCGFDPTLHDVRSWGVWPVWQLFPAPWGGEAFYSTEIEPWSNIYDTASSAAQYGYRLGSGAFGQDCANMVLFGLAARALVFLLLALLNRSKQR